MIWFVLTLHDQTESLTHVLGSFFLHLISFAFGDTNKEPETYYVFCGDVIVMKLFQIVVLILSIFEMIRKVNSKSYQAALCYQLILQKYHIR